MNATTWSYAIYLVASALITVYVGWTLFRNGRIFLVDTFHGNTALADSINHLLLVGFYLVNLGYMTMMVSLGQKPTDVQGAFEFCSWKVGSVLLILGAMHFINLSVFHRMRNRALREKGAPMAKMA